MNTVISCEKTCAIGIIFNSENQILIAKRPPEKEGGNLWEFPGGKKEPFENAEQALKRELYEEIGIEISESEKFMQFISLHYQEPIQLEIFLIRKFSGVPYSKENQVIVWVDIGELQNYAFLEGNSVIIRALQDAMPRLCNIE